MFPLVFQNVCIKFLLCNILPGLVCILNYVYEICAKTFFGGTFMCVPSFLVCARLMACVHAHSLEGTLFLSEVVVIQAAIVQF